MGSGAEDHHHPKKLAHHQPQQQHHAKYKVKMLVLVILTNLLTIYIFTGPYNLSPKLNNHISLPLWDPYTSSHLQQELNLTREQLAASHSLIAELHLKLNSTTKLLSEYLAAAAGGGQQQRRPDDSTVDANDDKFWTEEARLAIGPHKLPLGYSPRSGSDQIYPPVGTGCLRHREELATFMDYKVGGECPMDDVFAQRLMLKGCEPLPRRRCHPKSPANYVEPTPFPESLWATPPDTSVVWEPYTCKSYSCLIGRKNLPGYYDCKDCFDLQGREKSRWVNAAKGGGGLDYGMDEVLKTKPPGTIRIGLDIGGGTGTFAARMRERNITIITSSMNLDGPFNNFIASRGLIPIHLSVSHRLPFFDNTLDIVHSMHVLSNWIPDAMLEFTLYDIYRVLRPGGLFWLDHFFCLGSQLNRTYLPMLDRVGFYKLRWNAGFKLDRGIHKNEWYFSALFEKPMT